MEIRALAASLHPMLAFSARAVFQRLFPTPPLPTVAPQDEVYSQAHIDALGSCTQPWQLFVDGYDAAGNRLYDRERGTTCHQCRQKTLGVHTSCSLCRALRGSFCGDCLYMRYGENATEAAANPGWVCPPCRGLCNCSFHRAKLGWAATGALYRGAVAAGYPSVAHYLVLNNQAGEGQAVTAQMPRTAAGAASPSRPPRSKVAASPTPVPPTATKKSAPLSQEAAAAAAAAAAALAAPGRRSASFMRQTRVDGAVGRVRRSAGAGKLTAVKEGGVSKAKPAAVGLRRSLRGAVTA